MVTTTIRLFFDEEIFITEPVAAGSSNGSIFWETVFAKLVN